jgi:hypothetical protein
MMTRMRRIGDDDLDIDFLLLLIEIFIKLRVV